MKRFGGLEMLALFVAALCLVIAVEAIQRAVDAEDAVEQNKRAVENNRETLCGAARIVRFNPPNQLPGESTDRFHKRIHAYNDFLRQAAQIDCKSVLAQFERELAEKQREKGVGGSSGDSPSSQPGPSQGGRGQRGPSGDDGEPGAPAPTPSPTQPTSPGNSGVCVTLPSLPVCLDLN